MTAEGQDCREWGGRLVAGAEFPGYHHLHLMALERLGKKMLEGLLLFRHEDLDARGAIAFALADSHDPRYGHERIGVRAYDLIE